MDISVLWNEANEEGRKARSDAIGLDENPYPKSEHFQSPHVAWNTGWLETYDKAIEFSKAFEFNAGYHL